jgi:hypothetical protein
VSHPNLVLLGLRNVLLVIQTFVLLCLRNVFVSHEACSLLSFLLNASVMHPNHMSDYIYCVCVSICFSNKRSHLQVYFILMLITPCYLLDSCILTYSPTHDVIVC